MRTLVSKPLRLTFLLVFITAVNTGLFSMGEIQYPGYHQFPQDILDQDKTNKLVLKGLLSLRNPATKLLPGFTGEINPENIGFSYDNFTIAMILKAAGYQKEAEDILDYYTSRMRIPDKTLEYFADCNGVYGIIRLTKSKDNKKYFKSILSAVTVNSSSIPGAGGFEYNTTPGPLSFFLFALLQVNREKYKNEALETGEVLLTMQSMDGGITDGDRNPDRVYTGPALAACAAFEMLYSMTKDQKWKSAADKTYEWFVKNAYDKNTGEVYQGFQNNGPDKSFSVDCYAWTMAGSAGDRLSLDDLRKMTSYCLSHCLVKIELRLPDKSWRSLVLADFTDPSAEAAKQARGGFHPAGSVEWTGNVALALQKNAVRFWKAGDIQTAQYYKAIAEFLLDQAYQSFYKMNNAGGLATFYSTGQYMNTASASIGSGGKSTQWRTPVYYMVTNDTEFSGCSPVGTWPLLAYYKLNPFILDDDYKKTYKRIHVSEEDVLKTVDFIQKAISGRKYKEELLKQNPWPEIPVLKPEAYIAGMREYLSEGDSARESGDTNKTRESYMNVIRLGKELLGRESWIIKAKNENKQKQEEIGGVILYLEKNSTDNYLNECLRNTFRYPMLNEIGTSLFIMSQAYIELNQKEEAKKCMENLMDNYPLHQSALMEPEHNDNTANFRNALVLLEQIPPGETNALNRIYRDILKERNIRSLKPKEIRIEDTRRYKIFHSK